MLVCPKSFSCNNAPGETEDLATRIDDGGDEDETKMEDSIVN